MTVRLSSTIFSYDNGLGLWVNDTVAGTSAKSLVLNVTKSMTAYAGQIIKWKWYAFDDAGNANATDEWNYTIHGTQAVLPPDETIVDRDDFNPVDQNRVNLSIVLSNNATGVNITFKANLTMP